MKAALNSHSVEVLERPGNAQPTEKLRSTASAIFGVGTALPPNLVDQQLLTEQLRELWNEDYEGSRRWQSVFEQINRTVRVDRRYLALPLSEYATLDSFGKTNSVWARIAPELAAAAAEQALATAGLSARAVDHLFLVTGTGIATPSVDARIVNRLGMRTDVRRTPIFGLGCAGGVAAVGRAAELLRALPKDIALVVSVELCSLTFQHADRSIANVIASALFGDGAAAVLMGGANLVNPAVNPAHGCRPSVFATRSVFYPGTERMMGWDLVDSGFKIVLSPAIPELVRDRLGGDVDAFLAANGLDRTAISHWIAHTGGNRVLEAIAAALSLPPSALERSWRLLGSTGNLSSASVLFVLRDLIEEGVARPGELGMMLAMGPGFCAELALLQW
jgi:alkylresorcinol/alkylpyrone synthase